jgi:thiamine pyrophosphate-dependent acetolactate synthase large subunit-like protein
MATPQVHAGAMPAMPALQALVEVRRANQVVVTNQSSARSWPQLAEHPLDFHYNPSTMGGAIPLALGLALAQPEREVLVVSGDGSLLMSLGSLVTISGSRVTNLSIVVLDNGIYEVTGGQKTAASAAVDLAEIARGAGIPTIAHFEELAEWRRRAGEVLRRGGPRFICLKVLPTPQEYLSAPTPPLALQIDRLRQALAHST